MFNLFGKNLNFTLLKTSVVHRLSPRSSSSSPAASANSLTVSYLIESFGFPPEKAISASKYLNIKTPDRAVSVIALFKKQGFTDPQICSLVRKFPLVLAYNAETLLPKFEFLSSIGLSNSNMFKLFATRPNFLSRSLKNHIEPNYSSLRDVLQSDDRTVVAIKRYPWLLGWNYQGYMAPYMQILRDVGVPGSKILYLLTYQPGYFIVTAEQFKRIVEEVAEMGFDPKKLSFMRAVHAVKSISKSNWERKMETYEKWGLSKQQIMQAFRANPWCMMQSEEKIYKVMEFLVNKMGFEASIVVKNSVLISFSLEKRIIPRCLVYKYFLENGLMKDKNYCSFPKWLQSSESLFIERLERYEKEASGVLKFYQEKKDHAK